MVWFQRVFVPRLPAETQVHLLLQGSHIPTGVIRFRFGVNGDSACRPMYPNSLNQTDAILVANDNAQLAAA